MHALFDLDGTLTDPREGIVACIRHALRALSVEAPPEEDLVQWIGPPLQSSFRTLLGDQRLAEQALRLYRERFATVGMFENTVYPGIQVALGTLRDLKVNLLVATSKPEFFATRILEHFELARHFSGIYGSELSGARSDKAELLAYILAERTLVAHDTVMIGDRSHDVLAARRNSVASIGVLWGFGSRKELTDARADALVWTTEELVATVRGRLDAEQQAG